MLMRLRREQNNNFVNTHVEKVGNEEEAGVKMSMPSIKVIMYLRIVVHRKAITNQETSITQFTSVI